MEIRQDDPAAPHVAELLTHHQRVMGEYVFCARRNWVVGNGRYILVRLAK